MFRRLGAIGLLFLLVGIVGAFDNPPAEAARWVFVPHNCAEWEPIEHAERKTAILESLGVHRGKTIYCGIDQSDTFSAAEVFEAGKDHNQRDDTTYWGENGNFPGFTACQAGWLTDGAEGLTGCSTAAIFEFPRERVRDRDSGRRLSLRYGRSYESDGTVTASGAAFSKYGSELYGGGVRGRYTGGTSFVHNTYVWTDFVSGDTISSGTDRATRAEASARENFAASEHATAEGVEERARVGSINQARSEISPIFIGADAECRELGYKKARNINAWLAPDQGPASAYLILTSQQGQNPQYDYRRLIFYEAVCWSP